MNNSTQQEGRLRTKEEIFNKLSDRFYDIVGDGVQALTKEDAIEAMEQYHQQFSSPLSVSELKQKFAEHLGEKELNTTDAYAIEFAVKNLK